MTNSPFARPWLANVLVLLLTVGLNFALSDDCRSADPYERSGIGADRGNSTLPRDSRGADADQRSETSLREGTLIPLTAGRIVEMGRRWAFVPASLQEEMAAEAANLSDDAFGFPRRRANGTSLDRRGDSSIRSDRDVLTLGMRSPDAAGRNLLKTQIIVCENMMLQRVVEAIRVDASDDRWTISGEVTEFFGQNRLVIRTAQRAATN